MLWGPIVQNAGLPTVSVGNSLKLALHVPTGEVLHIDSAKNGMRCECTCLGCGTRLMAVQGAKRDWHFRHANDDSTCEGRQETALHRYAKQLVAECKQLTLPEVQVAGHTLRPPRDVSGWKSSTQEHSFHGLWLDVLLHDGLRDLAVEIAVTHRSDRQKLERLRQMDMMAVEIKLPRDALSLSKEKLDRLILTSAERYWLSHPMYRHAPALKKLNALRERLDKAAKRLERFGNTVETVRQHHARRIEELKRPIPARSRRMLAQMRQRVDEFALRDLLVHLEHGPYCRCACGDWQSVVLIGAIVRPLLANPESAVHINAYEVAEKLCKAGFFLHPEKLVPGYFPSMERTDIRQPVDQVRDYLRFLKNEGVLTSPGVLWPDATMLLSLAPLQRAFETRLDQVKEERWEQMASRERALGLPFGSLRA